MFLSTNLYLEQEANFVFLEGSSHPIYRLHSLLDRIGAFLLDTSIEENVAAGPMLARQSEIECQLGKPPIRQLE